MLYLSRRLRDRHELRQAMFLHGWLTAGSVIASIAMTFAFAGQFLPLLGFWTVTAGQLAALSLCVLAWRLRPEKPKPGDGKPGTENPH
jgi:hypothetical protein